MEKHQVRVYSDKDAIHIRSYVNGETLYNESKTTVFEDKIIVDIVALHEKEHNDRDLRIKYNNARFEVKDSLTKKIHEGPYKVDFDRSAIRTVFSGKNMIQFYQYHFNILYKLES